MKFIIPADVPHEKQVLFTKNYEQITGKRTPIVLFAADQKIEHLHADFLGAGLGNEAEHPEYIFSVAANTKVSSLATQLGLIARYGAQYPLLNYIVKLNSKTNLASEEQVDPISRQLWSLADVVTFKKNSGLNICGVGYTVYLGSVHESIMLAEAAQVIYQAHQEGLVCVLWVYPRGKFVKQEPLLLAGASGVANALGADFVKLAVPVDVTVEALASAVRAAGNTKILLAGGSKMNQKTFVASAEKYVNAGVAGFILGRNLFQRSIKDAQKLVDDILKI